MFTQKNFKKVISDDMYDFPRSHNVDAEQNRNTTSLHRRHCYNNAAPTQGPEGIIFQYDITPKPASSVNSVTIQFGAIHILSLIRVFFCRFFGTIRRQLKTWNRHLPRIRTLLQHQPIPIFQVL